MDKNFLTAQKNSKRYTENCRKKGDPKNGKSKW